MKKKKKIQKEKKKKENKRAKSRVDTKAGIFHPILTGPMLRGPQN